MYRGWMKNPVFKDAPYSEREAWAWLVENAAFKVMKIDVKGQEITLERGQMSHSLRYMAQAWKWNFSKVTRFLKRLENRHMITTESDTGQNVITICNYCEYQDAFKKVTQGKEENRHRSDTGATQERHKEERNKQLNNKTPLTPHGGAELFLDFDIRKYLITPAINRAKENAPKWDMEILMDVYNEGIRSGRRKPPHRANDAFPSWCMNYTKGKPP